MHAESSWRKRKEKEKCMCTFSYKPLYDDTWACLGTVFMCACAAFVVTPQRSQAVIVQLSLSAQRAGPQIQSQRTWLPVQPGMNACTD